MKKFLKINLLLLFVLFSTAQFCAGEVKMKTLFIEGDYQVSFPSELKVQSDSPVEDFILYKFSLPRKNSFLVLYIGNQPSPVKSNQKLAECDKKTAGGYSLKSATWLDQDGHFNGDIYLNLKSGDGWPSAAHFTYRNVSEEQKTMIDNIVNSFSKKLHKQG